MRIGFVCFLISGLFLCLGIIHDCQHCHEYANHTLMWDWVTITFQQVSNFIRSQSVPLATSPKPLSSKYSFVLLKIISIHFVIPTSPNGLESQDKPGKKWSGHFFVFLKSQENSGNVLIIMN